MSNFEVKRPSEPKKKVQKHVESDTEVENQLTEFAFEGQARDRTQTSLDHQRVVEQGPDDETEEKCFNKTQNKSPVLSDKSIPSKELKVNQSVISRRAKVILSNDKPKEELINEMLNEFAEFNKREMNTEEIYELTDFKFHCTSNKVFNGISGFLRNWLPLKVEMIKNTGGAAVVFGKAISRSNMMIKNKFFLSINGEVTILNMLHKL